MFSEGRVTFGGINCVYIESKDEIKLIPANEDDIRKLSRHFDDHDFFFQYSNITNKNCIAYIDRASLNIGNSLSFMPIYAIKLFNYAPVTSMEITGPAIDEIFHPASYYFFKNTSGEVNDIDLTRDYEIADTWNITVNGAPVEVNLRYGGILSHGIASDMKLHPKLVALFQPTTDCVFLFRIYSVITRFLQLSQYNSNFGECKVYLRGDTSEYNSGYLYDWKRIGTSRSFYNEIEYRYLKPYIEKMLQFSADNLDISLDFLPDATYRWNRTDYTPEILRALFAAFESEYKKNEEIYGNDVGEDLGQIKKKTIQMISSFSKEALSDGEKNFLEQAKSRIQDIGNQPGQTRKMKNVINELSPVLNKCAEHLFIRNRIGSKDGFSSKEIKQIVDKIVGMRALVSHAYTLEKFDDIQAEYIHFLEILVHAQMLKRAGIDDDGIVLIIGLLFHCNFAHMDLLSKWTQERPQ